MTEERKKPFNPKEHMMQLKGKEYLQVMWRLVWYRNENPDGQIETELVEHKPGEYAVVKATISEPKTEHIVATAYGSESLKDFHDYLEKAETKAIGRALAILGYGTQFAPELDEEERIVDSPVDRKAQQRQSRSNAQPIEINNPTAADIAAHAADAAAQIGTSDRVTDSTLGQIQYLMQKKCITEAYLCKHYHVKSLRELTVAQGENCLGNLNATKDRA